jgi:hypothetical protein
MVIELLGHDEFIWIIFIKIIFLFLKKIIKIDQG